MGGWKCQRRVEIGDKKRILRKIKFVENEKLLVEREEGSKESLVSQRLNRGVHLRTERSTDTAQQAGKMFGSVSYSFCLNSMFPYYLFSSWAHNVCIVSLVGLTSFVSECHITVSSTGLEKKRFVKLPEAVFLSDWHGKSWYGSHAFFLLSCSVELVQVHLTKQLLLDSMLSFTVLLLFLDLPFSANPPQAWFLPSWLNGIWTKAKNF